MQAVSAAQRCTTTVGFCESGRFLSPVCRASKPSTGRLRAAELSPGVLERQLSSLEASSPGPRSVAAAIPLRRARGGSTEVLMVSSRDGSGFVIPKARVCAQAAL